MIDFILWYFISGVILSALFFMLLRKKSKFENPWSNVNTTSIFLTLLLPLVVTFILIWEIVFLFHNFIKFISSILYGVLGFFKNGKSGFVLYFYKGWNSMPVFLGPFSDIPNTDNLGQKN